MKTSIHPNKNNKKVVVKNHAIDQFRKKTRNFDMKPNEIENYLMEIAQKGDRKHRRPAKCGIAYEVEYDDVNIVIIESSDAIVVITCLGDNLYRKWSKVHDIAPRYNTRTIR